MPGYTIAGKTGTASKLVNGRYSQTDYHASFVGFVPSRQPAFTILVVVDAPHAGSHYGGSVAAPIFQRIADAALRHAGVAPTINPLPPVLVQAAAGVGLVRRSSSARRPPRARRKSASCPGRPPSLTSAASAPVKPRAGSCVSVSCPG